MPVPSPSLRRLRSVACCGLGRSGMLKRFRPGYPCSAQPQSIPAVSNHQKYPCSAQWQCIPAVRNRRVALTQTIPAFRVGMLDVNNFCEVQDGAYESRVTLVLEACQGLRTIEDATAHEKKRLNPQQKKLLRAELSLALKVPGLPSMMPT